MTRYGWSVLLVWAVSLVAVAILSAFAGARVLTWAPVVLGGLVILTAAIQLSIQRKEGFVTRMAASLTGVLVILAATSVVLVGVHPGAIGSVLSLD